MAFQIQDDLLDIIADESVLGKNVGSDLVEKKKTYISIAARRYPEGAELLNAFHASNSDTGHHEALQRFRQFLQTSGIQRSTEMAIRKYLTRARRRLDRLPGSAARETLRRMVTDTESRRH
jgi:geranylgeranyl pyrophosphate synthase